MFIWDGLNALIDLMNSYGSNDVVSISIIMLVGAVACDQASMKYQQWKEKRHKQRK